MITRWLVLALAFALLAYLARSIVAPFIIAAVLAYIFSPIVDEAERRSRLPRLAVLGLLYVVLLSLLGIGIWLGEARLARETRALSEVGPNLVEAAFVRLLDTQTLHLFGQPIDAHVLAEWTSNQINDLLGSPSDAFHLFERAADWVLKLFLTLLALFYFLLDGRRVGPYLLRFIPTARRDRVQDVAGEIHRVLGRYLRGQLFLIFLMAVANFLVLTLIFHLPFALPIAIASGILEVIPLIGPIAAGAIAATVGLVHGGIWEMVGIIVAYFVLRQVEDQLIMPLVVGRAVHLHPLVPIFAVLTGGAIAGILGAILAVPIAAAIRVTLEYLFPAPSPDRAAIPPTEPADQPAAAGTPS